MLQKHITDIMQCKLCKNINNTKLIEQAVGLHTAEYWVGKVAEMRINKRMRWIDITDRDSLE